MRHIKVNRSGSAKKLKIIILINNNQKMRVILVLGCRLSEHEIGVYKPGNILQLRLEEGLKYYNKIKDYENVVIMVTGGDPVGNGVSEAEIMSKWFVENGVEKEKIYVENESNHTIENFVYVRKIIKSNDVDVDVVTIVTSDFHVKRSLYIATTLCPELKFEVVSAETPFEEKDEWFERESKNNYIERVEVARKQLVE